MAHREGLTLADFYIGQNDLPLWSETLTDGDGNPMLIQGATLVMSMVPLRGGADVVTAGGVVVNDDDGTVPNRGKVHRQMLSGETAASGEYLVRVVATQAGKPITFPNTGYFLWTITPTAIEQQGRYLAVEEFKATLTLSGTTFADADVLVALDAASRGLESQYNDDRPWTLGAPGEIRYYTRTDGWEAALGDVIAVTSVDLDFSINPYWDRSPSYGPGWGSPIGWGGGSYSTNLPAASYRLLPTQSGLVAANGNGEPYRKIELARGATVNRLPDGRDAIRVTGTFGWETVPGGVKAAVTIIASRLLRRTRDAPFGLTSFSGDERAVAVRSIMTDPDIVFAMTPLTGTTRLFA